MDLLQQSRSAELKFEVFWNAPGEKEADIASDSFAEMSNDLEDITLSLDLRARRRNVHHRQISLPSSLFPERGARNSFCFFNVEPVWDLGNGNCGSIGLLKLPHHVVAWANSRLGFAKRTSFHTARYVNIGPIRLAQQRIVSEPEVIVVRKPNCLATFRRPQPIQGNVVVRHDKHIRSRLSQRAV